MSNVMPTKRQVLQELRAEIDSWRESNKEPDGVVRDTDVLHSIRCLEVAMEIVRTAKFPRLQTSANHPKAKEA